MDETAEREIQEIELQDSTVGARITLPDGEWPVELRKSESTSESGAVGQRGALTGVFLSRR